MDSEGTSRAPRLPPESRIGCVALQVADLERSIRFYTHALGFGVLTQGKVQAELGVDSQVLLDLSELRGAPPKPENATGLYHFAVLLPTRADLGRHSAT